MSTLAYVFNHIQKAPNIFSRRFTHRNVNRIPIGGSFNTLYRFPYISYCSVISRCKKVQLGAVAVTVPTSYLGYIADLYGGSLPLAVCFVGLASTVGLFTVGQLFTNLIGYVYISRNQQTVKIAYLDFWGRRVDKICDIKDIKLLDDNSSFKDYFYKTVKVSSIDKPLKIILKRGEISHIELFNNVFKTDVDDFFY